MKTILTVLFNRPNCIGYVRILLVLLGACQSSDLLSVLCFGLSIFLDMIDGMVARYYNEESAFGEWLDVVIDLFTRGALWCSGAPNFGFLVFGYEFLVFVCLHSSGRGWQVNRKMPWLVAKTISKGFKTPLGVLAITGLWCAPMWVYLSAKAFTITIALPQIGVFLLICRLFSFSIEMWFLSQHVLLLLDESIREKTC